MKSIKFTLISAMLLLSARAFACINGNSYSPGEYYVFYSYDMVNHKKSVSIDELSIREWRKLVGNQVSINDIREVVYRYPLDSLKILLNDRRNKNTFVRYILKRHDTEIVDYLILAKNCETARAKRADAWWYPTKEDLKNTDLEMIIEQALAYKGKRLKIRYLLQAIRAAYSAKNYDLCLNLWEKEIAKMPSSAVKTMCRGYVGGIWFRKGDYEKAIECYSSIGDMDSFWWCADNLTTENSDIQRMKILYKYQPNAPELDKMLQQICREAEIAVNRKLFDLDEIPSDVSHYRRCEYYIENRKRFLELRNFALQVAAEKRTANPAMWQYAAAFLTFIDGKTASAIEYLNGAAELQGTPFIKENIGVLQMIFQAYATNNYDSEFETAFLPKLQWLDHLIVRDLDKKNIPDWDDSWINIRESYGEFETINNFSQYYPFDMLRKILLSVMIPKYLEQKNYTKVLLLAGTASHRLRQLVGYKCVRPYVGYKFFEYWDRSTAVFEFMNLLPVEYIIEYQDILKSGGRNQFESFFEERCYKNHDYITEIIGTKYLREQQFDKAIPYLSKVSEKYIKQMSVYYYFRIDPFRKIYKNRVLQKRYPAYKLNYAKKMLALQQQIDSLSNGYTKAQAMIDYAVALKRSISESWALNDYSDCGTYSVYHYEIVNMFDNIWRRKLSQSVDTYLNKAATISNNPEIRAQIMLARTIIDDYYDNSPNFNKRQFAAEFGKTKIASQFAAECDTYRSYFNQSYFPEYLQQVWVYRKE